MAPYNNFGEQVNGPNSGKIALHIIILLIHLTISDLLYIGLEESMQISGEIDITFSNNAVKTVMSKWLIAPLLTSTSSYF